MELVKVPEQSGSHCQENKGYDTVQVALKRSIGLNQRECTTPEYRMWVVVIQPSKRS